MTAEAEKEASKILETLRQVDAPREACEEERVAEIPPDYWSDGDWEDSWGEEWWDAPDDAGVCGDPALECDGAVAFTSQDGAISAAGQDEAVTVTSPGGAVAATGPVGAATSLPVPSAEDKPLVDPPEFADRVRDTDKEPY